MHFTPRSTQTPFIEKNDLSYCFKFQYIHQNYAIHFLDGKRSKKIKINPLKLIFSLSYNLEVEYTISVLVLDVVIFI